MKVVVNSDIVFHAKLIRDRLGAPTEKLLAACRAGGHTLIVPRTVLLELERMQDQAREAEIKRLKDAYGTLDQHRVEYQKKPPEELIRKPDLIALMRASGAAVEIEEATLDDFNDAQKRASLHLPPGDPSSKSDEMRDLVIWAISLRLARKEKDVLLVSVDHVHSGERGTEEAARTGLLRESSIDGALRALAVGTPAGEQMTEVVRAAWPSLRREFPQLTEQPDIRHFDPPRFERDEGGVLVSISCAIRLATAAGEFDAKLVATLGVDTLEELNVYAVVIDGKEHPPITLTPAAKVLLPRTELKARQDELQEVLRSPR